MILCALLAIAPLAMAAATPIVAILGALGPAVPVVADNAGSSALIATVPADSWIGREVDRRGRILPRRDARGRFIRSDAR